MLFNSYEFIFMFLPLTFFIYFYLLSKRLIVGAKGFLVFSSLFFYSWWNIVYLPLILLSMLFNYSLGNSLNKDFKNKKINKKTLLTFGIIANISLLGYFKYADFFIGNINYLSSSNIEVLNLALPLAISFFTFQQIAYLVDSYREETAEYDFLNYSLFVTFFPQLIAGPIVHHKEMMPQFFSKWNLVKNYKNIVLGLFIFSLGLFKKVIIADNLAIMASAGFDTVETLTLIEAWVTSLSYTFQLYFDFSGYTDMAIGVALLFNIKLPINFNSPYKAKDIQDFWRRWHITLSRFLRDYIYIPLGGSRVGNFRIYSNIMITFIIGGLWHGAGWTFVFWGFLHGFALCIHRLWKSFGLKMNVYLAWFITFNFVNISWVFFRAKEWDDAIKLLSSMFNFEFVEITSYKMKILLSHIYGNDKLFALLILAFVISFCMKNTMYYYKNTIQINYKTMFFVSFLYIITILELHNVSEFLYFNF